MPAIKYLKKTNKKTGKVSTYVYIVDNQTVVDSKTGVKRLKRRHLESLGVLGKDISKSEAKIALARFLDRGQSLTSNISFTAAYEDFKKCYKSEIGRTIKERTYLRFLDNEKNLLFFSSFELRKIKYIHIEEFKTFLLSKGLTNRSINILLMDLNKIFKNSNKKGLINSIPIIEKLSEKKDNVIFRLSSIQIKEMVNACDQLRPPANKNLKFYIKLMLYTGLRPHEINILKWENINLNDNYIHIVSDNNLKRGRKIPLTSKIKEILGERDQSTSKISPYTSSGIGSMIQRLNKKLKFNINPYVLRKTFGSMMAEADVPIIKLAEIMGNSITTCQKYYLNIQHETMVKDMNSNPINEIDI